MTGYLILLQLCWLQCLQSSHSTMGLITTTFRGNLLDQKKISYFLSYFRMFLYGSQQKQKLFWLISSYWPSFSQITYCPLFSEKHPKMTPQKSKILNCPKSCSNVIIAQNCLKWPKTSQELQMLSSVTPTPNCQFTMQQLS